VTSLSNAIGLEVSREWTDQCIVIHQNRTLIPENQSPTILEQGLKLNVSGYFYLAPGVMVNFEPGNPVFKSCLEALTTDYRMDQWTSAGPGMITRQYKKLPQYVNIQSPETFYPIQWWEIQDVFKHGTDSEEVKAKLQRAYGIHLFGKMTHGFPLKEGSLLHQQLSQLVDYGSQIGIIKADEASGFLS
jgi:hypothetical protein